jgi:hypothetical protein
MGAAFLTFSGEDHGAPAGDDAIGAADAVGAARPARQQPHHPPARRA